MSIPSAAGAAGVAVAADASISVAADLSACATVTFPANTVFVGEFSATGQVQGPGTKLATIRGVKPFAQPKPITSSWSGCISGAYAGAAAGSVKYTLVASSISGGEVVYVVECVVKDGQVTCA
ncbi:MAG TPA: hypothetical protein VHJ76_08045 [Actinomycetota bacterium]|nr:hypothetical protein [Actinomycetota bacterium]